MWIARNTQGISMKKKRQLRSHCPINFALEAFGDMWSLLIVRDIMFFQKMTYGEFLRSEEQIATNILADRLIRLEENGIIKKVPHLKDKRKDTYTLAEKGMDLSPMLMEVVLWSAKYDPKTAAPKALVEHIKNNRAQALEEIQRSVRNK